MQRADTSGIPFVLALVLGMASQVGDKSFYPLQLDLRSLRGGQIPRHDDDPFINVGNTGSACAKEGLQY